MDDGVVQLSSKSHHENILGSLHQLRLQGQLSDVTVLVDYQGEAEEFPAHQVMLAASSGYFKRILLSQDAAPNKLFLSNMHTADFSTFLEFVYTGKVEVAKDKIGDVREVAAMLDCSDLSAVCSEALDAGQSDEPAAETSFVDEEEKAELEGTYSEMTPKTRTKRPPRRKRYLSPKSSKRGEGGGSKRSKVRNAVKAGGKSTRGEEGGTTRLSSRLAGRKVLVRVLKRKGDESAKEGLEKNADVDTAVENTDEVEPEAKAPLQQDDKISLGLLASEDEGDEPEEMPEEDLEDPLYLSLEEEEEEEGGDAQRMLKRVSKAQFECEKCQRTFHYERSYLKHISTYHGVKSEVVYRCETCQQTFKNRGNLKIHEKHVHSDERGFTCQVCAKTFKRKKDVIRHQRQVHEGGGQRHICPLCGKALSSKTALLLHERTHTGAKPFECTICNAKFTQSSALKMHHRTHTGEKPFACDECNARFTQKHMLSYHKRSHTGEKPFMCEACGKSFASKEYLRHHSNIHTGSRPYKCEQCGRGFAQRNSLHQHLKIHTGERPYSCKECEKQFTQLNALQRHQRIHTGEKPYMCGLCNRTFTDKSTVRRHTMTHDTDAPWKNYLVVLDGNIEDKKPQDSPKETAEKTAAVENTSSAGSDGAEGSSSSISGGVSGGSSAQTIVVPAEPVTLSANWASHGISHSGLGGIIVIHGEVPPGTQFQPIMTTDATGANVISLDGSAISVPFSIPVSMAHPLPVSSSAAVMSSSSLSVPVSLSIPVSETMLASVSEPPAAVSNASVLEAAVSQTIFAPVPEADMLDTDIQTVIISEKECVVEQPATTDDEQQRTAEQMNSEETPEEVPTEKAE